MIDGRFRVQCALRVALSGFKGIILLHDCERPQYAILFQVLELVSRVERLAVFKVRATDNERLNELVEKHLYDAN